MKPLESFPRIRLGILPTPIHKLENISSLLGRNIYIKRDDMTGLGLGGNKIRKLEFLLADAKERGAEVIFTTGGDIYFGLAESYQIRYLAREVHAFKKLYPDLRYHITSGDTEQVTEKLDKGLLDFAVICEAPDEKKYRCVQFPESDYFDAVFSSDSPLAQKAQITAEDLAGLPLFTSEQSWENDIRPWAKDGFSALRLEGSFRLAFNGSLFAREGLGVLLTLNDLIDTSPGSGLVFRPLYPRLEMKMYLIWNKYQSFTPIAERFLKQIQTSFARD